VDRRGRPRFIASRSEEGILTAAEVWYPATAAFGPAGALAEARSYQTATLLPDGGVQVVGGSVGFDEDSLASAEVWAPSWRLRASREMAKGRDP
jgi:hypothetical protein